MSVGAAGPRPQNAVGGKPLLVGSPLSTLATAPSGMQRSPLPPARGLAAVNACYHPIQDVTKPHTPAMGHGDAKAMSVGTAVPVPQKRRRWVNPYSWACRRPAPTSPNRNETQPARPLAVGRTCVYTEPKALVAGTAGPPSTPATTHPGRNEAPCPCMGHGGAKGSARRHRRPRPLKKRRRRASPYSWACRRLLLPSPNRNETQPARPLLVGRTCVYTEPKALVAGTAGPLSTPASTPSGT